MKEMMKNKNHQKTAVIGAGSWGTALALALASKGYPVALWGHKKEHVAALSRDRENSRYLPGFSFPENLQVTDNLVEALSLAVTVLMVVPSHGFRKVYSEVYPLLEEGVAVVSAVKGVENETLMTMSEVMTDVENNSSVRKSVIPAVLSGPSFAKEVAKNIPTAITIGCSDIEDAKKLQQHFVTDTFRVYASTDIIGLEISAALKNIVAIAAGICDGLGYGTNTRAALITRGLAEITRFGENRGAQKETFFGLSGVGDLLLTCTGDLSRNRSVGISLGKGIKLTEIIAEMNMVAEGVKTTKSIYDIARKEGIDMPITEQVYEILYNDKECAKAVDDLLKRELKAE